MWTDEVLTIELQKTERGLGFSILDYQDPLNPSETVIVIRSLVPGGIAQQDGRLISGDRLMFVNNVTLGNASLDTGNRPDRRVQAAAGDGQPDHDGEDERGGHQPGQHGGPQRHL